MPDKKTAIISDVHSNYEALQTVLSHAHDQGVEDVWFLGDAVGYGPDPHRCLKLLAETVTQPDAWVLGNHDEAMRYPPNGMGFSDIDRRAHSRSPRTRVGPVINYIGAAPDTFNAFRINYEILDAFPERRDSLLSHPTTSQIDRRLFLVHGGVRSGTPTTTYTLDRIHVQNEFRLSSYKITRKTLENLKLEKLPDFILKPLESMIEQEISGEDKFLELIRTMVGDRSNGKYNSVILQHAFFAHKRRFHEPGLHIFFFGHTHFPACFKGINNTNKPGRDNVDFIEYDLKKEAKIHLDEKHAWFLNPGSVGQPRDRDPRASYMILDRDGYTLQLHRVEYNVRATQKQMEDYGMPPNLIERLTTGR